MAHRRFAVLGTLAIAAVLAVTALTLFSMGSARTASAEGHGIQNLHCTINPPIASVPTPPETLTCTFDFRGSPHTFVADFQISMTKPPLRVTACTLDGKPVHIGPCPG